MKGLHKNVKVVAFLQNMWVKDPDRARAMIEAGGEAYRRRLMVYSLFAGCLTGRRLKAAFGELCDRIHWEEATREIAGDAHRICPPDPNHIKAVLTEQRPGLVITFGRVAGDAVAQIWTGKLIRCPHPAARQRDTMDMLRVAAGVMRGEL